MPLTSPNATPAAPAAPTAQAPVVEARGLTVTLDATPIVRGIDLAIPAGQMVALLGANGSGKSTTIKALLGILPHEGRAALFGQTEHRLVPW
ncbi:MAG: ATP-binding cassette domain-containing protein, partial [Bifidobacteriaceae bacterium]|nr:ATP-binding cassette domain-containing protein [Bifidobacteriaceae bacterium]